MEILPGVDLPDDLLAAFVEAGGTGHEIALAHHTDPWSNGYTFGADRYHRSCEMAREAVEDHGFSIHPKGAAFYARRNGIELRFATAKSPDLWSPSSFDMTTRSRLQAGRKNHSLTPQVAELAELLPPETKVVHVVWSGDSGHGLTAVHVGHLVTLDENHVQWNGLARIDQTDWKSAVELEHLGATTLSYTQQKEPDLELSSITPDVQEGTQGHATAR